MITSPQISPSYMSLEDQLRSCLADYECEDQRSQLVMSPTEDLSISTASPEGCSAATPREVALEKKIQQLIGDLLKAKESNIELSQQYTDLVAQYAKTSEDLAKGSSQMRKLEQAHTSLRDQHDALLDRMRAELESGPSYEVDSIVCGDSVGGQVKTSPMPSANTIVPLQPPIEPFNHVQPVPDLRVYHPSIFDHNPSTSAPPCDFGPPASNNVHIASPWFPGSTLTPSKLTISSQARAQGSSKERKRIANETYRLNSAELQRLKSLYGEHSREYEAGRKRLRTATGRKIRIGNRLTGKDDQTHAGDEMLPTITDSSPAAFGWQDWTNVADTF